MSRETIRCPNAGRRVMAILAVGLLFTMVAGCPPRKPTPVAGPAAGCIRDSCLVARHINYT